MNRRNTLFLSLALLAGTIYSQAIRKCSSSEAMEEAMLKYPQMIDGARELEEFTKQYEQLQAVSKTAATAYVIPVVVHILHNFGDENISDLQVLDAIKVMNEDFSKTNPDASFVIPEFTGVAADMQIEFRLAQKDPSGNCTNGIDRIPTILTYNADDDSKLNGWPRNKYLNIWVVKKIAGGAAGNAYLPNIGLPASIDGIMILHDYFSSIGTSNINRSHAISHEVGHFLNLQHVWGSSNTPGVACGNDGITDTPNTKGWSFCPSKTAAKVCNAAIVENYQNFMEYSYCDNMFTLGQKTRAHAALNSTTSQRNNLWKAANLTATGTDGTNNLCAANFTANRQEVCQGGLVTYYDNSYNGVTSRTWSFPGGTPATFTGPIVTVTYPNSGKYSVTLSVSDGVTTKTSTQPNYIEVFPTTAEYPLPYSEGFESSSIPNNDWGIENNDSYTWSQISGVGATGNSCAGINNFFADSARVDGLISPTFDFTTYTNPKLYYKVAYAQTNASSVDKLEIQTSTNCGQSWANRQTKSGNTLKSVTPKTNVWSPSAPSDWRADSIALPMLATQKNVRIRFKFTNGSGNNIYLDDINVKGSSPSSIYDALAETLNFGAYPNPSHVSTTLHFNLIEKGIVSMNVFDILGKNIRTIVDNTNLSNGEHTYSLNTAELKPGIYFVRLMVNERLFVQKVIVD